MPRAPWQEIPTDLQTLRKEIDWLSCAEPVLSFLRTVFTEPHQLIFLGDHQGRVLLAHGGHRAMAQAVILLPQPSRPSAKEHTQQPWSVSYTFSDLVGQSLRFQKCLAQQASQHDWPVLLLGESGTGKELFAQAIHSTSPRNG